MHNRYLSKDTKEYPPNNLNGIFCPIDVSSGGTWFGFNENGLLLGITNQETKKLDNPGRSRGLLALDILDKFTDADFFEFMEKIAGENFVSEDLKNVTDF